MHCLDSFMLQDLFKSLSIAFEVQNTKHSVNILLTCILYCDAALSSDQNCLRTVGRFLSRIYMLFTGWEVRTVKNCDWGLENAARGRITYLFFPSSKTKKKKRKKKSRKKIHASGTVTVVRDRKKQERQDSLPCPLGKNRSYYLSSYVFLRRRCSFTSRKLYISMIHSYVSCSCLIELMFLDVEIYSSFWSFWDHMIQMQLFTHKSVDCFACCKCGLYMPLFGLVTPK